MKRLLLFSLLTLVLGVLAQSAHAQSLSVSGQVVYADDQSPVIGATVIVDGTNAVAVTDVNGNYQITVPASSTKQLTVNYAGLAPQTKTATSNGEVLNFVMEPDAQSIENVVVTGYGSARKVGTVVGSVQQVGSKELQNRPSASVMDALQGKVAGLQIYNSTGEPGTTQSIRLHGIGSLNAGSTPLYILDGIQVSASTIQGMNPNDFESVTVLKDASATSIYGSRAANGVIVYTTKRGVRGDAKITVNGYYGTSTQASTKFYDNMMSSAELLDLWMGLGWVSQSYYDNWVNNGSQDTDWFGYYNRAFVPVYSGDISISGGNSTTNYYISGNVYSQEGNAYGSYYDRISVRSNINSQVKPWMSVGANIQLSYADSRNNTSFATNNLNGGLSYIHSPLNPTFYYADAAGNKITYQEYIKNGGQKVDYWSESIPGAGVRNPEYVQDMQDRSTKDYSTASSGYITLEPIKNLKITSRGGLEFTYRHYKNIWNPAYTGNPGNGSNYQYANQYLTGTLTNTIEYMFDVADDHNFVVLAGQEGVGYTYSGFNAFASGITDGRLDHMQFGDQSTFEVESYDSRYSTLSFFGRADYAYKDIVFVDASVRNDQTSRFAEGNRSGVFWAIGGMVNLKNLLLQDHKTITDLSAKVSYGTQGNQDVGSNFPYQGIIAGQPNYGGDIGWGVSSPANPDLGWETQTKLTVSARLSLWNRLNITAEYYLRNTHDMLMSVPLPSTTGFSSIKKNVGGLQNQGVDLSVDYDILRTSDYGLNVGVNFNYNQQKVTELFDGRQHWTIPSTGITYVVGQAVQYYYPIHAGVNPETGKQEWYVPGEDFTQTTMGETTTVFNENTLMQNTGKNIYAPIAGGFNIGGNWKGLSLQADFNFMVGKWMMNNDAYFSANPNSFKGYNTQKDVTDYWQKPGDIAKYPNWNDDGNNAMQFDTHLVQNASFLRLKNLTLAYQFPTKWFQTQNVVSGFRLYATGRNLFTVTEYGGIDPEVDSSRSMGTYPNTKQFILGLELTF